MSISCWSGMGRLVTGRRGGGSWGSTEGNGLGAENDELKVHGGGLGANQCSVPLDGQLHRLLELLPEDIVAGRHLQAFWGTFKAVELRPLLDGRQWSRRDSAILNQVRKRCLVATYPFSLAEQLLEGSAWRPPGEGDEGDEGEVAAAARRSEQWDVLMAVQRVVGPLDMAKRFSGAPPSHHSPGVQLYEHEISNRREEYLALVRAFKLVAASFFRADQLRGRGVEGGPQEVEEGCVEDVHVLLAAQHMLPPHCRSWRSRPNLQVSFAET